MFEVMSVEVWLRVMDFFPRGVSKLVCRVEVGVGGGVDLLCPRARCPADSFSIFLVWRCLPICTKWRKQQTQHIQKAMASRGFVGISTSYMLYVFVGVSTSYMLYIGEGCCAVEGLKLSLDQHLHSFANFIHCLKFEPASSGKLVESGGSHSQLTASATSGRLSVLEVSRDCSHSNSPAVPNIVSCTYCIIVHPTFTVPAFEYVHASRRMIGGFEEQRKTLKRVWHY